MRRRLKVFPSMFIICEFHGRTGDVGINGPQIANKPFLTVAFPNVSFGVNLKKILAGAANKAGA
jgi:hypothetical protein